MQRQELSVGKVYSLVINKTWETREWMGFLPLMKYSHIRYYLTKNKKNHIKAKAKQWKQFWILNQSGENQYDAR